MGKSTRHHYIPEFYSKGFLNNDGFLFIYDKKKGIVQSKRQSPKSIFFENDRNTLELDEQTSILEDVWYKQLDNKCKYAVQSLREDINDQRILTHDNLAGIQLFILHLFWRIPKTDYAFERYVQDAQITFINKDGKVVVDPVKEQELKNDINYKKYQRAFISNQALKTFTQKPGKIFVQLFDKVENLFLIGDYPMVFRQAPRTFDDLMHLDYYLPISSNRLFYSAKNRRELEFDLSKIQELNSLVIDQSVRYICSPDREYLQFCVDNYRKLSFLDLHRLRDSMFNS